MYMYMYVILFCHHLAIKSYCYRKKYFIQYFILNVRYPFAMLDWLLNISLPRSAILLVTTSDGPNFTLLVGSSDL